MINEYWIKLGCNPTNESKILLNAWNQLAIHKQTIEMKLFIKANLDPYYHEFLQNYQNLEQLLPAGFFDDGLPIGQFQYHDDFFTTPVHKIIHNIEKIKNNQILNKPFLIILNTGSYSPIHIGHIQMMEEAKEVLSKHYHVVGGYLSPSHDKYVSRKYEGTASYHADARISLCEEVVSESDWLMIDPWEARYNDRPINFTNIIIRIKKYLKKHISENIHIAYVFGSDNAGFSWAFLKDDISVCFERPNYHLEFETVKNDPKLNSNHHFFIPNKNNAYSSKAIREGHHHFLPEKIKQLYFLYSNNQFPIYNPLYLIRDDRYFATKFFPNELKNNILEKSLSDFYSNLLKGIKKSFNHYTSMEIISLSTEQQNNYLNKLNKNIINIDGCTFHPKQHTIGVSRLFALSDGQVYAPKLIARPGLPTLEEQIISIPNGDYTLIDDDIASGRTVELIQKLLPDNVHIDEFIALSKQSFYEFYQYELSYQFHDIVDFRDFLIGSHHGGLVVELPNGKIARAPYTWPYVSLSHRAKIPYINQLEFSLLIWKLNYDFYSSLPISLSIKDMEIEFQNLALYLGFNKDDSMTCFCEFHINKLQYLH